MRALDIAGAVTAFVLGATILVGMVRACEEPGPAPDWVGAAFWIGIACVAWFAFCVARLAGAA